MNLMSGDSIKETYGANAAQVPWKVTNLLFADGEVTFNRKYSFMSTRQKENPAFLQGRWLFDIDFCTLKS